MRVLFPYMARWHSANRTRFHHLLAGLAARGHRVVVFQPPPVPGGAETNLRDLPPGPHVPGLEVRDVPVPAPLWSLKLPLAKLARKGLATLLTRAALERADGPDAVLLLYNVPQVALARAVRAPVVVDVADDLLAMLAEETGAAGPLLLPVARRAWRSLLARADVVTAASSVLAEPLGARLVPNGASFDDPPGPPPNGRRRVGYVGAFEYFVDLELLLRVAALLPDCAFDLVGGGRHRAWLEREIVRRGLPNVEVRGPLPHAQALQAMRGFDVAVIPFRPGPVADAASPLKLFEYLAAGRPVLGTPAAEMRRVAGRWMDFASTPEDWAAALRRLLADPAGAALRAKQARAEAAGAYDWRPIVDRFEAALLEARRT